MTIDKMDPREEIFKKEQESKRNKRDAIVGGYLKENSEVSVDVVEAEKNGSANGKRC